MEVMRSEGRAVFLRLVVPVVIATAMSAGQAAADATLVKDIRPGAASSAPSEFARLGNTMLFRAADGVNGVELWKSDGTAAGTVLVKDIEPGDKGSDPRSLTLSANGLVYFRVKGDTFEGGDLWRTDGTPAGTVRLTDLTAFATPGTRRGVQWIADVDGTIFFGVDDGHHELWKSDGTREGTGRVKEFFSLLEEPEAHGGKLYFVVSDEIWTSDGTLQGTTLVKELADAFLLTSVGDELFFAGSDDPKPGHTGLWKTDGTAAGTVALKRDFTISFLTDLNGTLIFSGRGTPGMELWTSDGTPEGTVQLTSINTQASAQVGFITAVGDEAFFTAISPEHGNELWKTDGTAEGTMLVKDIFPGTGSSADPTFFRHADGIAYFIANDGVHGDEPWRSDGTAEGTFMLRDVHPGPESGLGTFYWGATTGAFLYFAGYEPAAGSELWAVPLRASLAAADVTVTEGHTGTVEATFAVRLTKPVAETVTVEFETADGTASAGGDYTGETGTLTFAPGETEQTVTVFVNGDYAIEGEETFFLRLSNASNAWIDRGVAVGRIAEDDPSLTIDPLATASENDPPGSRITLTVRLSGPQPAENITVDYRTVDGSAIASGDYFSETGRLFFSAGDT
jgi:ELWxxDGT repeat protein